MTQVTMAELMAGLPHVLAAPKTDAPIQILCFRPGYGQRTYPDQIEMTVARGIPGERWETLPWLRLPDGSPDPRIQVSILPSRVLDLVWRDREAVVHPGDTIVADLDCSAANMPVGTRLQIGTAVIEVSDEPNDGCAKWKVRYGADAMDWIIRPEHSALRLRGILCRIVQDGVVRATDRITVLR